MFSIFHYNLLHRNTFGIEAWADRFVEYASEDELVRFVKTERNGQPLMHIGSGSNLLFCSDYNGIVLHSGICSVEELPSDSNDTVRVRVGSGLLWDDLVSLCVDNGWHGLENLSLVPGEVGAAAVQNIGAYGAEAKDFIENVEVVDMQKGTLKTVANAGCCYAYRSSAFKKQWAGRYAVTHVTLRLNRRFEPNLTYAALAAELELRGLSQPTAKQMRQTVIEVRQNKLPDPKVTGNAGSFFMNPVVDHETFAALLSAFPDMPHYKNESGVKIPAAWLIERAGWKGRSQGAAGVYDKQALVLVNMGGASGRDIAALSQSIVADVKRIFGITLKPEVMFI